MSLDEIRKRHERTDKLLFDDAPEDGYYCGCDEPWPCDAVRLLERVGVLTAVLTELVKEMTPETAHSNPMVLAGALQRARAALAGGDEQ